jgi:hypothetical protein
LPHLRTLRDDLSDVRSFVLDANVQQELERWSKKPAQGKGQSLQNQWIQAETFPPWHLPEHQLRNETF